MGDRALTIRRRFRHRSKAGAGIDEGAGDDRARDGVARGHREHPRFPHRRADRDRRAGRSELPELGRDQARHRLYAGVPLPGGEDGRRDHPERKRYEDHDGERSADARPDDPLARDGHQAPYGGARVKADGGAGDRRLAAPRGGVGVCGRGEVHPRGHPGGAGEGQSGAGDAGQVPHAPGPGVDAADRAGVRGRGDAPRRAHRDAALRARHAYGGRDRALHRRAGLRGAVDRDAAGGDDGWHRRREGGARARLPLGQLRRGVRRGAGGDRAARSPGPARLWAAGRAARV